MTLLLDTNVVSELRKVRTGKADANFCRWAEALDVETLFTSVIVVHELEVGVLLAERRDPKQGAALRLWLEVQMIPAFVGRILPIDAVIGRRAARLHVPDPQPINDALIAATALVNGMTLATRNTADFTHIGVSLVDPWAIA